MTSTFFKRAIWLVLFPAVLIGGAMFASASIERQQALRAAEAVQQSQRLLTGMLDQETGARGFFDTGRTVFLQPWSRGAREFTTAYMQMRAALAGSTELEQELETQHRVAEAWHATTAAEIANYASYGIAPTVAQALSSKAQMDSLRTVNTAFNAGLDARRNAALARATWLAVLLAAGLSLALTIGGLMLLQRSRRREQTRARREAELRELMQVCDTEDESRSLLIRHIERMHPGIGAAILNRNNSDDRLEPVVSEQVAQTPLRDLPSGEVRPRDCLAVRLSRPHERRPGEQNLAQCDVCGKLAGEVACEPLLVGGKVIGSVLIASPERISPATRAQLRDSVVQTAPIIAHQRSLALAERRAASDALTGLPNRRAADDAIKRLAAQAGRSLTSLSAVLLDLDHFKQINDVHGHDRGDETLAAIGPALAANLRASDFAARYGGEEFLVLLPETTAEQAELVAEKLRLAIQQTDLGPISLTASFGIAAMPEDAADTERLLRRADQALYAAKQAGRNCVVRAGAGPAAPSETALPEAPLPEAALRKAALAETAAAAAE